MALQSSPHTLTEIKSFEEPGSVSWPGWSVFAAGYALSGLLALLHTVEAAVCPGGKTA